MVLALTDDPASLDKPPVRWLGTAAIALLFAALLCALRVVYPAYHRLQRDNVGDMEDALHTLLQRKSEALSFAVWCFALGMAALLSLVLATL